jgi:hypothetical protein
MGFNVTGRVRLLLDISRTTLSSPKHRLKVMDFHGLQCDGNGEAFNRHFGQENLLCETSIKSDRLLMGFNVTAMVGLLLG